MKGLGKIKMKKRLYGIQAVLFSLVLIVVLLVPIVSAKRAAKPKLNKNTLNLVVNKTAILKVKGVAHGKVKKVSFSSNKRSVVKVNGKGKVTALKKGNAKITVKVHMKNNKKYTLKCTVKVKEAGVSSPVKTQGIVLGKTTEKPGDSYTDSTVNPISNPTANPTDIPGTDDSITNPAFQMLQKMGIGINLGNTMESVGNWFDQTVVSNFETAWGSPIITKEMIVGMHKAGFETIRVPVAWSNIMSDDGEYIIDESYINRVDQIIGWALEENMYVIINDHYDGGWWGQFGSEEYRDEAWKHYESIWTQLSSHYKDYSEHLIFESANEELGDRLNDAIDDNGKYDEQNGKKGRLTKDQCYDITNEINQKFVDIVRASGGNNATRFLLIAGYNTDINNTCDSRYHMPTDTIEDHLMISIHCYSPATYCIAEDPANSWGYKDKWGSEEEKNALRNELEKMKLRFTDKGIPVIIGEYGVANMTVDGKPVRKHNRMLYFEEVCKYALDNGMCPVLWDTTNHVYNREQQKMIYDDEAEGFLALSALAKTKKAYRILEILNDN